MTTTHDTDEYYEAIFDAVDIADEAGTPFAKNLATVISCVGSLTTLKADRLNSTLSENYVKRYSAELSSMLETAVFELSKALIREGDYFDAATVNGQGRAAE